MTRSDVGLWACVWLSAAACSGDDKSSHTTHKTAPAARHDAAARPAAHDAAEPADARVEPGSEAPDARAERPAQRPDASAMQKPMAAAVAAPAMQPPTGTGTSTGSGCTPRPISGDAGVVHFHHVHFNTVDPAQDREFFDKYLGAPPAEFCRSGAGAATLATKTERGWFLYTKVAEAPDPTLNTYLEHIGWIHPDPNAELQRLVMLGAPRYPQIRSQCETAFNGTMACNNYWFYLQAPSGARIEVAKGPGPAAMGFGHVHMIMGIDFDFFDKATNGAVKNKVIDMVNHTDVAIQESVLATEQVVETRGKPIDHLGYSTVDLDAEKARVLAAGLTLAEDISFKPEYGFRSFFMKSQKGVWIEMVEDTPFAATP